MPKTKLKPMARVRSSRIVMCVHHRTGWCELLDQHNTAYRDMMETKCGHVVTLPWGIRKQKPDCIECKKAHNHKVQQ